MHQHIEVFQPQKGKDRKEKKRIEVYGKIYIMSLPCESEATLHQKYYVLCCYLSLHDVLVQVKPNSLMIDICIVCCKSLVFLSV